MQNMIECWQPDAETFSSCAKGKCEAEWGKGFKVEVGDWHWTDLSDNIHYGAQFKYGDYGQRIYKTSIDK